MASPVVDPWESFHRDRPGSVLQLPQRRALNWGNLAQRTAPPRKWIIPGWLAYDPTLLVGTGGVGKTLLGQHLGTALATNTEFIGRAEKPLSVLMWACEDDKDELWRRQEAICRSMGVDMAALAGSFIIEPRRGLDSTLIATQFNQPVWTPLYGELQAQVNDYHADILLLDNVGQTFGANENDRHHVTYFINGMVGLTQGDFCPILFAHPARGLTSEYAGSAAWENAVRMRWLFGANLPDAGEEPTEEPESDVRYLSRRKSNYSAKDWRCFKLAEGALELEQPIEGEASMHQARARRVALDGFRRILGMGQTASDSTHAANYLPKMILGHRLNEGLTRKQLADALSSLMLDGVLKVGVAGKYANGGAKMGLVDGDSVLKD